MSRLRLLAAACLALSLVGCAATAPTLRTQREPAPRLSPEVLALFLEAGLALQELPSMEREDTRADRAVALLERAIALEPDSALLHRYLAEAWAAKPDAARSIGSAREAVRLDPTDAEAHYLLGEQLHLEGRLGEAESHLREAARRGIGGDDPERPHRHLYQVLREQDDVDAALAALSAWSAALPDQTEPVVTRAVCLWETGRADEAERAAVAALRIKPKSEDARDILARYHRYDAQREAEILEGVLEGEWSSRDLHRRLVEVYGSMGRYDKALAHLRYVGMLDRRSGGDLSVRRATFLSRMHRHDEAIELLESAAAARPGAKTLLPLADVLRDAGRVEEAMEVLARLEPGDPAYWQAALRRGRIQLDRGDPAAALATALAARQVLPLERVDAHARLLGLAASATLQQDDFDTAEHLVDELALHDGRRAHALRIRFLRERGDLEAAAALEYGELAIEPAAIDRRASLADLLAEAGRVDEALAVYDQGVEVLRDDRDRQVARLPASRRYSAALEADANVAYLMLRRSFVEKDAGRLAEAQASLEAVLERFPRDADALNALGYLWAEQGTNLERAEQLLSEALEQKPFSGAYQDSLGWILYHQGRHDEAIERLETASSWIPGDPEILEHLGDAYRASGDADRALATFRDTLSSMGEPGRSDAGRTARVEEKIRQLEAQGARAP